MQSRHFILETFICCYEFITDSFSSFLCKTWTEIQPFRFELFCHFYRNYFSNTFQSATPPSAREYNYVNKTARSNTLRTFNICCIFLSKFSCDGRREAKKNGGIRKKVMQRKATNPFRKWHLWKCHWADVEATACVCGSRAASIFVCSGTHDVESQKFCIFICCFCWVRVNANARKGASNNSEQEEKKAKRMSRKLKLEIMPVSQFSHLFVCLFVCLCGRSVWRAW